MPVLEQAAAASLPVRGYVSCVLGCPYEEQVFPEAVAKVSHRARYTNQQHMCGGGSMLQCRLYMKVIAIASRVIDHLCPRALPTQVTRSLLEMGCYSVSLGDTIGAGTPGSTLRLVQHLRAEGLPVNKLAAHFHDTYGQALANILVALEEVSCVLGRASDAAVCHSPGEIGVRISTLPNCSIRVCLCACWCLLCTIFAERSCTTVRTINVSKNDCSSTGGKPNVTARAIWVFRGNNPTNKREHRSTPATLTLPLSYHKEHKYNFAFLPRPSQPTPIVLDCRG